MPDVGTPSLDQLQVFLAVVEAGSFAAAGRRLNRATSAISYTIGHLEKQLGIALFDRERTRKPVLTDAEVALLSKARAVSGGIDDLRATVRGLRAGLEAEVALVVDVMLPTCDLMDAVRAFEAKFPTVTLRLHVEALSAVAQLVQAGIAGIGVGGTLHTTRPGLRTNPARRGRNDSGGGAPAPACSQPAETARRSPSVPAADPHRTGVVCRRS